MARRGRPARFDSPEEMKTEIEAFFESCQRRKEVPLISWMEHKLQFRFRDYSNKARFKEVCEWAREESEAICEQMAFTGKMTKTAASLYLRCKRGYIQENKLTVTSTNETDIRMFDSILDDVRGMDDAHQEAYIGKLREIVDEQEV